MRTRDGDDVEHVIASARRIFGSSLLNTQGLAVETEGARNAIELLALSLWLFAGVAAVVGIVTIGVVVTRELAVVGGGQTILSALGATRLQRVATFGPTTAVIASGAVLGAAGAGLASPIFPIGLARRAEPDPGPTVDWPVLVAGAVLLAVTVTVIAALVAMRMTRERRGPQRTSHRYAAAALAERSAACGLVAGGDERPAPGRRFRPRADIRAGALGVPWCAGGGARRDRGVRVHRELRPPRRHTALVRLDLGLPGPRLDREHALLASDYGLAQNEGIADLAEVCFQNVQLDGRPVPAWGVTQARGTIVPALLEGRAPAGPGEVALGSKTLHALDKRVGDSVTVAGREQHLRYRIVGRTVLPSLGSPQPLADAAWFTGTGFAPLFDQNVFSRYFVGRYTRGADRAQVRKEIDAVPQLDPVTESAVPVEINRVAAHRLAPACDRPAARDPRIGRRHPHARHERTAPARSSRC